MDPLKALIQDNDILIEENSDLNVEIKKRDELLNSLLQVAMGHGNVKQKYKGSHRSKNAGSKLANIIHQIRQFQHYGELDTAHLEEK